MLLVLINPHSGRGKSVKIYKETILPFFELNQVQHQVFISEQDLRVREYLIEKLTIDELLKFKSIIIVSGDGLLFETINSLSELAKLNNLKLIDLPPLGIIPTGSGNGMAYTLLRQHTSDSIDVGGGGSDTSNSGGVSSCIGSREQRIDNVDEAIRICCEQAIQEETIFSDLVKITIENNRDKSPIYSFLSIGWGLLADIDIDSEWLRRFGEFRFTIYGLLRSFTANSYKGRLSYKRRKEHANNTKAIDDNNIIISNSTTTIINTNTSTQSNKLNNDNHDENCCLNECKQPMHEEAINTNTNNDTDTDNNTSTNDKTDATVTIDDNDNDWTNIEDKFACLYAVHQAYVSRVTKFAPKSTLTDGLIYLTFIRGKLNPCKAIEFMLAIEDGSHEKLPYVTVAPVTCFKFQPLEASKVVIDGELTSWSPLDGYLEAEIVPKSLKLLWNRKI